MIKILFLIHDLGQGGAEKVLVNLVNNMDRSKFNISVIALFGGGVNEQFLKQDIRFKAVFSKEVPGNSKLMKLLTPTQLHRLCVHEKYDIEVSYLEGPAARVISGCTAPGTKLVSWIHVEQHTMDALAASFRSEKEAVTCYNRFDQTVCVSEFVKQDFCRILNFKKPCTVLYNTLESEQIMSAAQEPAPKINDSGALNLVAVGSLKKSKGYDRLLRIVKRFSEEGYHTHLYILGMGELRNNLESYVTDNQMENYVTFLGYQTNPYKYMAKCDLLVCASHAEGFSTAVSEALIVGTPVCTVKVSGMCEMLGDSEYGLITENNEEALYQGIKKMLDEPELLKHYRTQAKIRGIDFNTMKTVESVEKMLVMI